MATPEFEVRYRTWEALSRDVKQQMTMGGVLLRTDEDLDRLTAVSLRVVTPGDDVFELSGEVLQVVPGQGLAVQFGGDAGPELQRLSTSAESAPVGAEPAPSGDDPEVRRASAAASPRGGMGGADPQDLRRQVEEMSVAEKRKAALHGRREVRLLLIRDRNKAVHPFVVKNPGITLDEIEQISKMPSVNPDALRMIAKNPDWTRSPTVCRNLVRNPKTPMPDALALVPKLPMSELRILAKTANARTAIQQAARKKVIG